jgi:hypothetical protein
MSATNYCQALIDANIEPTCEDLASGYERTGVIINREDVDFATSVFSETDPNTLTVMPLKSGKKGFKIVDVSLNPFASSTNKGVAGTYTNSFDKEVHLWIPNDSPEVAKVIDEIANGEFVVVLPKKQKNGGKSEFEIVGFENGCRADAGNITNEPASDNGDGWNVVLKEKGARKSKIFLFNTDAATTEAAVAAYYA